MIKPEWMRSFVLGMSKEQLTEMQTAPGEDAAEMTEGIQTVPKLS